jgi:protein ImuB
VTSAASGSRRYLALWFPFLPTDRLCRETPSLAADTAFAIVEKVKGAMRLAAVAPGALALGIAPGLTLADSRARLPDLIVFDLDLHADAVWLERIADGCDRYTPMVAVDGAAGLMLDISGCAHLFDGEDGLCSDLRRRLERLGMQVRLAVADTPDAAHARARHGAHDLHLLPVEALDLQPEETVALRRAGLKKLGDLASRPSAPLSARFGQGTSEKLARVTGANDIRISPRRAEPALVMERRFAEPIGHVDAALAAIADLAGKAAHRMEQSHRGGRRFEVQLFRTDGLVRRLRIETGLPARDVKLLMRLFAERIEALDDPVDPGFGFDLVRLSVPLLETLTPLQLQLVGV